MINKQDLEKLSKFHLDLNLLCEDHRVDQKIDVKLIIQVLFTEALRVFYLTINKEIDEKEVKIILGKILDSCELRALEINALCEKEEKEGEA